jgi:hypothetical protein
MPSLRRQSFSKHWRLKRIARFEHPARSDTVRSKMAKPLPEFAPGHNDARLIEIADAEWPNRALGRGALCVAVGKRKLAFGPDSAANRRKVKRACDRGFPRRHNEGRCLDVVTDPRWQDGGDLNDRIARCDRELFVGPRFNPAGAQNERLDLLAAQHQRRKPEAWLQNVAQPRFALDLRALPLQANNVAVECS